MIVYEEKPPQFPPEVIGKVRTSTLNFWMLFHTLRTSDLKFSFTLVKII